MKKNHLALKIIAVVLAICIVLGSVSCALVYFDIVDIPFIAKILGKQDEDSHFTNLEGKFTDIKITDEKSAIEAVASVGRRIGIENAEKDLKVESVNTVDSDSYYRMQQYYNDIPVYGRDVIVAADKDGNASALTANTTSIKVDTDNIGKPGEEKVVELIRKYFNDDKATVDNLDNAELVIYVLKNNKAKTAYKVKVTSNGFFGYVIVDSKTGKIFDKKELLNGEKAEVKFAQDETIKAEGWKESNSEYKLYNEEYNISIFDFNGSRVILPNGSIWNDFTAYDRSVKTSSTDKFDDRAAVFTLNNVIACSKMYSELGYKGFDIIHAGVHIAENNSHGVGSIEDNIRYASLAFGERYERTDTIGHEYTHAVSDLIVDFSGTNKETGAIDEAYSDIFGELLESFTINGSAPDWMGSSRNFIDPGSVLYNACYYEIRGQECPLFKKNDTHIHNSEYTKTDTTCMIRIGEPEKYNGDNYYSNSEVHHNSTVISHAAYLMWNGINGTEDFKIDSEKLAKLWYRALLMMPSDATFAQCANAVATAAWQMYRDGEQLTTRQVACVRYAFQKVGITPESSTEYIYTNSKLSVFDKDVNLLSNYHLRIVRNIDEYNRFDILANKEEKNLLDRITNRESVPRYDANANKKIKPSGVRQELELETDVENGNDYVLNLTPGNYTIYVTDNSENGSEMEFSKNITISNIIGIGNKNEVTIYTDFGSVEPEETTTQLPTEPEKPMPPSSAIGYIGMTVSELKKVHGDDLIIDFDNDGISSDSNYLYLSYADKRIPFSLYLKLDNYVDRAYTDIETVKSQLTGKEVIEKIEISSDAIAKGISIDGTYKSNSTYNDIKKIPEVDFGSTWGDIKAIAKGDAQCILTDFKDNNIVIMYWFDYKIPKENEMSQKIEIIRSIPTPAGGFEKPSGYEVTFNEYRRNCLEERHGEDGFGCNCGWIKFDIDGNGTKELIIREGVSEQGTRIHIYELRNGKSVSIGDFSGWHLALYDVSGTLTGVNGMGGQWTVYKLGIRNGKAEIVGSYNVNDNNGAPKFSKCLEFSEELRDFPDYY